MHLFAVKFLGLRAAAERAVCQRVSLKRQAGIETIKFKALWKNKNAGLHFGSDLPMENWAATMVRSFCKDITRDSKLQLVDNVLLKTSTALWNKVVLLIS